MMRIIIIIIVITNVKGNNIQWITVLSVGRLSIRLLYSFSFYIVIAILLMLLIPRANILSVINSGLELWKFACTQNHFQRWITTVNPDVGSYAKLRSTFLKLLSLRASSQLLSKNSLKMINYYVSLRNFSITLKFKPINHFFLYIFLQKILNRVWNTSHKHWKDEHKKLANKHCLLTTIELTVTQSIVVFFFTRAKKKE